ncbi:MAG: hypothetical protein KDB35_05810 [Acidimicrobiales bacterium]|nr:hypothetical protein [Acidimicrobiales bacterium]
MLSSFDDYPIHQTVHPIARPDSEDRNKYDRFWFNGYDRGGDWYFGIGMGRYPNLGIMDCALSLVTRDGDQRCFFGSRRAPADPTELTVGPYRLEIVEPMRRTRLVLEDNETGIAADLTFTARTACVEEGRQTWQHDGRTNIDNTRFAQFGTWTGVISIDGDDLEVHAQPGTKDRSWGLRVIGAPDPGVAPLQTLPQFWFLWNPVHWDDHCTHVGLFEYEDGHPWHTDAAIVPAYDDPADIPGIEDPGTRMLRTATHAIDYRPGTRWAQAATITLVDPDAGDRVIDLDPVLRFHMRGIGYRHPVWGHGLWHGDLAIGRDDFRPDDLDPLAIDCSHVQQVVRARCGDDHGIGVLEQYSLGPHAPSGFTAFDDGAPG